MVLAVAWVVASCVVRRKRKGAGAGAGTGEGKGGLEDFEPVPWSEYDEGRPTRPTGFEFVLVERKGWRERLG